MSLTSGKYNNSLEVRGQNCSFLQINYVVRGEIVKRKNVILNLFYFNLYKILVIAPWLRIHFLGGEVNCFQDFSDIPPIPPDLLIPRPTTQCRKQNVEREILSLSTLKLFIGMKLS